ncbi:adenylate/guanylate cyclase domain-containing protein [Salidesulfovibrio onnuriiensis]|uniref:adenylate/guanylate cyclase domain-containing protein n=1 Tax=Salidesulfovibrio onnuriiensis TaxID=2583823 RepID=UPI00202B850D|nr:adenylate/guanylate cyclase domain-containing protein [Salidesulfovibrio onnuriiensis]
MKIKKDSLILLLSGMAITLLVVLLYIFQPTFLKLLDYKIYDQLLRKYHSSNATDRPVIVDIDEKSLARYGQWPWPRYRVALLLGNLMQMGARAVGSDIIFVERDNTSLVVLKEQLKRDLNVEPHFSGIPRQLEDNDKILANLLAQGPFVLGLDFIFGKADAPNQDEACLAPPCKVSVLKTPDALEPQQALHAAAGTICPLPELAQSAPASGFITIASDEDGIFRRVPLLISWQGKLYPSLAASTLMQATGISNVVLKLSSLGVESLRIGPAVIPVDRKGQMLINYRGPSRTFNYISAADVLSGTVDPAFLKDRIVFIGTSASGLRDLRPMPFDNYYPGVETHATIVDNILSRQFISTPSWGPALLLFIIVCVGLLATMLITWTRAAYIVLPLLGVWLGLWYGSVGLYTEAGLFISPFYPFICLASTFIVLTVLKFWREEHAKQFIQGAFAHYLAPSVINRILDDPDSLSLEGQEKEVTIQFSDIRSFTSLSEKLTPTQVTELLHDYMTPMTRIITAHSGTLDKFIGDAIMAFWNAPLDVETHQLTALEAALEQLDKLEELNRDVFTKKYGFTIAIGIGVHCGTVRVGNMGSADLFDYTLIGDNVNLASRLEGLTKFYGQKIVVSQTIAEACCTTHVFQELDRVRVKGKVEPVTIYTVHRIDDAERKSEELALHEKGLALYKKGNFSKAAEIFETIIKEYNDHMFYSMYAERCHILAETPPEGEWDGVFTHKSK